MPGHSSGFDNFGAPPVRVSDIQITQVWQIECADHGIVDEPRTFAAAIKARREHFFRFHKEGSAGG